MKKLVLPFSLLFLVNCLFAQSAVLNVCGTFNNEKLPLDSIKLINKTTGDSVVFKNLPDSVNYHINMEMGVLVKSNEFKLGQNNFISELKNLPGYLSFKINKTDVKEVDISVFNINGQKVYGVHRKIGELNLVYQLHIAGEGLFLIQVSSARYNQTLKCLGNYSLSATQFSQVLQNPGYYKSAELSSNFRFAIGDQATVIIYKSYYKTQFLDFTVGSTQDLVFKLIRKHEISGGSFLDERDGTEYRFVNIGSQSWMAENLNYKDSSGCWTIEDYELYSKTYGRLYNYNSAMRSCPAGWHLPSDEEWSILAEQISIDNGGYETDIIGVWQDVGKHLKAKGSKYTNNGLWKIDNEEFEGLDDYGFSAIPAASRLSFLGEFFMYGSLGYDAEWWSSTPCFGNNAWNRSVRYNNNDFARSFTEQSEHDALSIRCVKNID